MKTVFLHIGLHKTGTSSIQKFLSKNHSLLLDNSIEYLLPKPWPIPFTKEPVIDVNVKGFEDIGNSSANKIVISHENYSWIFEEEKARIIVQEILKHADQLKVILYLRRQDSLAISQKQEGTKWIDNSVAYGHELSALPKELNYFSKNYLNFYDKAKLWAKTAGKSNLIIRILDKEKLVGGDVVKDFCHLIGADSIKGFEDVGRVNESIPRKKQLFLHLTRPFFPENTPEKHQLVDFVLNLNSDDSQKLLPSKIDAKAFYQKFSVSNAQLKNEFFPEIEGDVFSNDFSMYSDISNENYSERERLEFFSLVVKNLLAENEVLRDSLSNSDKMANWYRDLALKIEAYDLKAALELMRKAKAHRPKGPFIKSKIDEYISALSAKDGAGHD